MGRKLGGNIGRKLGRGLCPLFVEGSWVSIEYKVFWDEAYLYTKWHLDASSRLAAIEIGRKLEKGVPLLFWGEGWVPI